MKKRINKQYMQISLYVIVTCSIIYILSLVASHFPEIYKATMGKLGQIYGIIKPIILAFAFAYILDGVVTFFENRLKKIKLLSRLKSTRGIAVLITMLLVLAFIAGLITLLIYSITDQIRLANFDDFTRAINELTIEVQNFVTMLSEKLDSMNIESEEIKQMVGQLTSYIMGFATSIFSSAAGSVSGVTGFLSTLLFSIIICIYFLIDGKMVKANLRKVSRALFSDRFNSRMRTFIIDADTVFSGYMKGQLMDAFVMMVLISITLTIIDVRFAIIIGIIAGIGNLIPYFGPFIAYGGSIVVCLISGEFTKLIIALIALFVIQAIDGNIIGPKLLSHSIKIHPLLVIISLIFGSSIGGLFGMLLAVPIGALIKVIFMRYIENRLAMKEALRKLREPE